MRRWVLVLALAACSSKEPAPSRGRGGGPPKLDPEKLVTVEVLAAATAVAPGGSIDLGVRFAIEKGWHIYWLNPGESGLSTDVEIAAPAGFTVGEVRYPGPVSFATESGTSYGYHGETVLFATVQAPAEAAAGPVRLTAKASWLACREVCVRGKREVGIDLAVGTGAKPTSEALLAPHAALLPRPASELAGLSTAWSEDGDHEVLSVSVAGAAAVELFPFEQQPALYRGQAASRGGEGAVVRARFDRAAGAAGSVGGVLRVDSRYYAVSVPWPT